MLRSTRRAITGAPLATLVVLCSVAAALAVGPTQIDDFEDGSVMGWSEGPSSPNPPVNVATGGPQGADDNYLENVSSGGSGSGSHMTMFNNAQWTGDYNALGTVVISADMANFGATILSMRVALETTSGGRTRYSSTTAASLPADGQWYRVRFPLTEDAMTLVEGSLPLNALLDNLAELRIISSGVPSWRGDAMVGQLGVDNIAVNVVLFADGFEAGNTSAWGGTVEQLVRPGPRLHHRVMTHDPLARSLLGMGPAGYRHTFTGVPGPGVRLGVSRPGRGPRAGP